MEKSLSSEFQQEYCPEIGIICTKTDIDMPSCSLRVCEMTAKTQKYRGSRSFAKV